MITDIRRAVQQGHRRILVVLPTGGGKSVVAASLMQLTAAKGNESIFFASQRELITQIGNQLKKIDVPSRTIMAGVDEHDGFEDRVDVLCSLVARDTLWQRAFKRDKMELPTADVMQIDECHQVGCPTYVSIMEAYEKSIIIGWTATPCRSDNRPLGLWFDTMVQGATYKELQDGGYLVPVKVIAPDRPDLQGCKVSRGDYAKGDLQKRMNRDEMVGNIVKEWLKHGQGRSTVLFAAGVDHSIHCRDVFRKEGITAEHIDGKMSTDERDDIMLRARNGQVRVVCNYGVLHTGVDVPNWKVMICARPTKSFGLFRQMAGRIQRPYQGHDHCLILDHSDNTLHFGFPDEDVEWEIDGEGDQGKKHMEAKKREPGEKGSEPYACEKCHSMYRGYACPVCGHKPEKKGNEIKMSSGELKELERAKANRKATPMDKQKHWDKCMGIAIQKGMKIGAAAHMYKEHFGCFPVNSVQNVPRSSQWKMTAKDFYMQVVKPEKRAAEREIQTSLLW
jgi:superfamily II DNA or RNA helicase